MADATTLRRDIASILPFSILRYVANAVDEATAVRVRVAAGETRSRSQLGERGSWSSLERTLAIADAAAEATGDHQIGRRGGEELFRFTQELGFNDAHRASGSVAEALEAVVAVSSRLSVGRVMQVVDRASDHVLVEGRYTGGTRANPLFCDYSTGYFACVPTIFGATGYAAELECEARGADHCLIQVSWSGEPAPTSAEASAPVQRAFTDEIHDRYAALQRTAAEIVSAEDVAAVLELVVQRVGNAVLAPRFLLVVQLPERSELLVHHLGFRDDASARRAAKGLLDGAGPDPSTLVVGVESNGQHYGSIAAFYPRGATASDVDRKLMSSYAAHAAAALEATVAFERARRDRDTAEALLGLSRHLAGAVTVGEVASRLAEAVPPIAGGCRGSVYLWDAAHATLRLEACDRATDPQLLPDELVVADIEGGAELLAAGGPVWLDVAELTGDLRALMERTGVVHNVSVPINARGDFLGLLSASFVDPIRPDERRLLIQRLLAVADQAAVAVDNARLLERATHLAMHDPLTGLPNRPMLEDRVDQALARSRRDGSSVALLFIDLDRFKDVNDTLGHHAGDLLIQQAAGRLRRQLRDADTHSRLGGDEFVVLLPDVRGGDVATIASRLVESLHDPFDIEGQELAISCSVGVAMSPLAGTDCATLLRHADGAMYAAKNSGRDTFAFSFDRDVEPDADTRQIDLVDHR
jgi:diguanylate cyclase (GGDEF)-like protein